MAVLLVTGDAPYLGGHATWASLRKIAPEFDFTVIDLLEYSKAPELRSAMKNAIAERISAADALIAHSTAAGVAIEAVASSGGSIPLILLSPRFVKRDIWIIRVIRGLFKAGASPLRSYARRKHRRLLRDREYVKRQLRYLVAAEAIDDVLLDEAITALCDPRMDSFVERTPEVLQAVLTPVDAAALGAIKNQVVIGEAGAPMLERAPEVIDALRNATRGATSV